MFWLNLNIIPLLFHLLMSLLNLWDDLSLRRGLIYLFTEPLLRFSLETLLFFYSFLTTKRFFFRLLFAFKFGWPRQLPWISWVGWRLILVDRKFLHIRLLPPSFPSTGLRGESFLCADGASRNRGKGEHVICIWGLWCWSEAFSVWIRLGKLWLLSSFSMQIARIMALIQIHFN